MHFNNLSHLDSENQTDLVRRATICRRLYGQQAAARLLVETLFDGLKDWSGKPYITHLDAVADGVQGDELKAAALLHDLMEDIPGWGGEEGVKLLREIGFSDYVIDGVVGVTKTSKLYLDEMVKVGLLQQSRTIKKSDLRHNINSLRNRWLYTEDDRNRLNKYKISYFYLDDIDRGVIIPGTTVAAWMAQQPKAMQDWALIKKHSSQDASPVMRGLGLLRPLFGLVADPPRQTTEQFQDYFHDIAALSGKEAFIARKVLSELETRSDSLLDRRLFDDVDIERLNVDKMAYFYLKDFLDGAIGSRTPFADWVRAQPTEPARNNMQDESLLQKHSQLSTIRPSWYKDLEAQSKAGAVDSLTAAFSPAGDLTRQPPSPVERLTGALGMSATRQEPK